MLFLAVDTIPPLGFSCSPSKRKVTGFVLGIYFGRTGLCTWLVIYEVPSFRG